MNETRCIIIKKYPNRRLYDTESSRYINLEDVADLIRNEKEVKVIDTATGNDITKDIMLQIISESQYGKELIPLELLRNLIAFSGNAMMAMMKKIFESQSDIAEKFQKIIHAGIGANPIIGTWLELAKLQVTKEVAETEAKIKEKDEEIAKLKEEINALQQIISNNLPASKKEEELFKS